MNDVAIAPQWGNKEVRVYRCGSYLDRHKLFLNIYNEIRNQTPNNMFTDKVYTREANITLTKLYQTLLVSEDLIDGIHTAYMNGGVLSRFIEEDTFKIQGMVGSQRYVLEFPCYIIREPILNYIKKNPDDCYIVHKSTKKLRVGKTEILPDKPDGEYPLYEKNYKNSCGVICIKGDISKVKLLMDDGVVRMHTKLRQPKLEYTWRVINRKKISSKGKYANRYISVFVYNDECDILNVEELKYLFENCVEKNCTYDDYLNSWVYRIMNENPDDMMKKLEKHPSEVKD